MKKIPLLLITIMLCFCLTAQNDTVSFVGKSFENLPYPRLRIKVYDFDRNPMRNMNVFLIRPGSSTVLHSKTNGFGIAGFAVTQNKTYDVMIERELQNRQVNMPDIESYIFTKAYYYTPLNISELNSGDTIIQQVPDSQEPTMSRFLCSIWLYNLKKEPRTDEAIILKQVDKDVFYKSYTDSLGFAKFLLPKAEYTISFELQDNVDTIIMKYPEDYLHLFRKYYYKGTKELKEEFLASHAIGVDTVVLATLRRNAHWENKLIVTDLTGSMSPYSAQILLWHELNYKLEPDAEFVFFNDGDTLANDKKEIGKTGGIYYCANCSHGNLLQVMAKTTSLGNGGDGEENDVEAIIAGIKMAIDFSELILIADAGSAVRDIELISKLNVPVRVILCGSQHYIHMDYFRLAYETGGSLHTIEEDIIDLAGMMEGETIRIGKNLYKLEKGRFIEVDEI